MEGVVGQIKIKVKRGKRGQPTVEERSIRDTVIAWVGRRGVSGRFELSEISSTTSKREVPQGWVLILSADNDHVCSLLVNSDGVRRTCKLRLPGKRAQRLKALTKLRGDSRGEERTAREPANEARLLAGANDWDMVPAPKPKDDAQYMLTFRDGGKQAVLTKINEYSVHFDPSSLESSYRVYRNSVKQEHFGVLDALSPVDQCLLRLGHLFAQARVFEEVLIYVLDGEHANEGTAFVQVGPKMRRDLIPVQLSHDNRLMRWVWVLPMGNAESIHQALLRAEQNPASGEHVSLSLRDLLMQACEQAGIASLFRLAPEDQGLIFETVQSCRPNGDVKILLPVTLMGKDGKPKCVEIECPTLDDAMRLRFALEAQ